jgi:hypothetical protein
MWSVVKSVWKAEWVCPLFRGHSEYERGSSSHLQPLSRSRMHRKSVHEDNSIDGLPRYPLSASPQQVLYRMPIEKSAQVRTRKLASDL